MTEHWKDIPGYEGRYQASSLGRIASLTVKRRKRDVRHLKSVVVNPAGYHRVHLHDAKNNQKSFYVHRLVAMAFHPTPKTMRDVCHLNGVKSDNRASNLKWASRKENESHKIEHGTKPVGSKVGSSKLTESDVLAIRMLSEKGYSERRLSLMFGVVQQTINSVLNKETWKHI